MVGDGCAGVVTATRIGGGQFFVIFCVVFRSEMPVVVIQAVGVFESIPKGQAINVPLAGVVRMVPEGFQKIWQKSGPGRADSSISAGDSGDRVASNLLGVISRENRATRGPASGGVVKLGEAKPPFRQFVQIWCFDFAPVATKVREAEVIRQQKEDIGLGRGGDWWGGSGAKQGEHSQTGIHLATPGEDGKGPYKRMGLEHPTGFPKNSPSMGAGTGMIKLQGMMSTESLARWSTPNAREGHSKAFFFLVIQIFSRWHGSGHSKSVSDILQVVPWLEVAPNT